MRRFLAHFRPSIGLLMETELWPNLAAECGERGMCRCSSSTRGCPEDPLRGYERVGAR